MVTVVVELTEPPGAPGRRGAGLVLLSHCLALALISGVLRVLVGLLPVPSEGGKQHRHQVRCVVETTFHEEGLVGHVLPPIPVVVPIWGSVPCPLGPVRSGSLQDRGLPKFVVVFRQPRLPPVLVLRPHVQLVLLPPVLRRPPGRFPGHHYDMLPALVLPVAVRPLLQPMAVQLLGLP